MTLFTLDPTCNIEHALKMVEGTLNVSESFIFGRSSKLRGQICTEDRGITSTSSALYLIPEFPTLNDMHAVV